MWIFNHHRDNAWTQADRRDRRKTVATVIVILMVALFALSLLVWGLIEAST